MRANRGFLAVSCALAIGALACSPGTGENAPAAAGRPAADPGAASAASSPPLPAGHPPVGDGQVAPSGAPQGAVIAWTTPASWKQEPPTSRMRYAQYRVSGVDGDPDDAECAVFYFGPGQGGSPEENASRWVGQFAQPDGSSSQDRAKIDVKTVNGKEVMFVEVGGTYTASMMGAPGAEPKKDYSMLAAIVPGPDAPWFFKLTGPRRTIEANREAFTSLIASIH